MIRREGICAMKSLFNLSQFVIYCYQQPQLITATNPNGSNRWNRSRYCDFMNLWFRSEHKRSMEEQRGHGKTDRAKDECSMYDDVERGMLSRYQANLPTTGSPCVYLEDRRNLMESNGCSFEVEDSKEWFRSFSPLEPCPLLIDIEPVVPLRGPIHRYNRFTSGNSYMRPEVKLHCQLHSMAKYINYWYYLLHEKRGITFE